jgi:zinc transport system substrate-binding protein
VAAGEQIRAVVGIPPIAFFVERIGGPQVAVDVLVAPGQSPHAYEPTPRQAAALAEADVYFACGMPFESRLLDRIRGSFTRLRIVDTCEGITLRTLSDAEHEHQGERGADGGQSRDGDGLHTSGGSESYDGAGSYHHEHTAGEPDPHVWLNPQFAIIIARNVAAGLGAASPAQVGGFEHNAAALIAELSELDGKIAGQLAPLRGRTIYVYHPAYGYFADRYGLRQRAVEAEGKEPGARELASLIERARAEGVRVIFVQPQFPTLGARHVADAIGGAVVPLDDLSRDYVSNLKRIADELERALQPAPN